MSGTATVLSFDLRLPLAVVEEATMVQAKEVETWQALQNTQRCVLAGDHHQLPRTCISQVAESQVRFQPTMMQPMNIADIQQY
jgi:hypothetical protein